MIFLVSATLSVLIYFYFYKLSKDALNPFGISISIYLFMYGLSTLNLSIYQEDMQFITHILIILPIFSMVFVGYYYCTTYKKEIRMEEQPVVTHNFRIVMVLISAICLLSVLYLIATRGFSVKVDLSQSAALNTRKGEVTEQVFAGSGIIGKFAQLFPYTVVFVAYDFLFNKDKRIIFRIVELGYCVVCFAYTLFVLSSRGTLLLPLLAVLILLNKKYHFKPNTIGILLLCLVAGFTAYMGLRVIYESAVFSGTAVTNRTFNSIYNYFALGFNNFDKIVKTGSPYTIIQYSFISLSKVLGVYNEANIINHQTLIFNEEIFIYGFYHDLGALGIILFPTLIYVILGKIYVSSRNRKPEMILLLAMFGKAFFVLPFGNYFFGSISMELQYYVCILVLLFGYRISQLPRFRFGQKFSTPRMPRIRLRIRTR